MSHYLTQVSYTSDAWSALVKNPVNRMDQIRPAVEKLGGKIVSGFMAFGDYDLVLITEMPTNADAAAIGMAAHFRAAVRRCDRGDLRGAAADATPRTRRSRRRGR